MLGGCENRAMVSAHILIVHSNGQTKELIIQHLYTPNLGNKAEPALIEDLGPSKRP